MGLDYRQKFSSKNLWHSVFLMVISGAARRGQGALPQTSLGDPAPRPILNGVWGEAQAGFGAEPQLPPYIIQSSQQVLSSAGSQICLWHCLSGGL